MYVGRQLWWTSTLSREGDDASGKRGTYGELDLTAWRDYRVVRYEHILTEVKLSMRMNYVQNLPYNKGESWRDEYANILDP